MGHHFLSTIACGVIAVSACARAEEASVRIPTFTPDHDYTAPHEENASSLLWQNASLTQSGKPAQPGREELRQGMRAFLIADPTTGQLYSLRQLVKGNAQRQWKISQSSMGEIRLALGSQALPVFQLTGITGTRAAIALTNGNLGLYSTRPLNALNGELKAADAVMGEATSNDASQMDWLSARPLSSTRGTVDVIFLQGQNDLNPYSQIKTPGQFTRGAMAGAKVAYLLPLRWKMNGEWMASSIKPVVESSDGTANEMESPTETSAYLLTFSGPVAHPFGETGVRFSYREIGADFMAFNGKPEDAGTASSQLSLQQPFERGALSGEMEINWSQQVSGNNQGTSAIADNAQLQAASSLHWQATPAVALTASHKIGSDVTRDVASVTQPIEPIYNAQRNRETQVGLEWRLATGVSLSLNGGETRYKENSDGERFLRRLSNRDNQYSLGLRSQSPLASWNLQLERRAALDLMGETGSSTNALSIDAQRRLTSWLQMRGSYRFSQSDDSLSALTATASGLTAGASLSLQELGALELSYSQTSNAQRDGVRWNNSLTRGYGARYSCGAQNGQNGLGFSVDYSKTGTVNLDNSQWRVGLTYR